MVLAQAGAVGPTEVRLPRHRLSRRENQDFRFRKGDSWEVVSDGILKGCSSRDSRQWQQGWSSGWCLGAVLAPLQPGLGAAGYWGTFSPGSFSPLASFLIPLRPDHLNNLPLFSSPRYFRNNVSFTSGTFKDLESPVQI